MTTFDRQPVTADRAAVIEAAACAIREIIFSPKECTSDDYAAAALTAAEQHGWRPDAERDLLIARMEGAGRGFIRATLDQDTKIARLTEHLRVAVEALTLICAARYGLQGIKEDFGHDANAYNYRVSRYYRDVVNQYKGAARTALALIQKDAGNV